jgi:hypothetical protein
MSEFAFFRFMSNNMLTTEEQQHEDVLRVKGIECDSKIEEENKDRLEEIDIAVH